MKLANEIAVGDGVKTWFGTHTIVAILPYTGPFKFILNILRLSNGMEMSNEETSIYEVTK